MALRPYDPVGAMGGLFAPALIRGNRQSEEAFERWLEANQRQPPAPSTVDAPPAPPAPTMEGAPPESAEEAAARQRDAIARTILMLQGGDQGGSGIDTTAPLDPSLDPNPHTGPPSLSASPTPPPIDIDNTPPGAPPTQTQAPPTQTQAPPTQTQAPPQELQIEQTNPQVTTLNVTPVTRGFSQDEFGENTTPGKGNPLGAIPVTPPTAQEMQFGTQMQLALDPSLGGKLGGPPSAVAPVAAPEAPAAPSAPSGRGGIGADPSAHDAAVAAAVAAAASAPAAAPSPPGAIGAGAPLAGPAQSYGGFGSASSGPAAASAMTGNAYGLGGMMSGTPGIAGTNMSMGPIGMAMSSGVAGNLGPTSIAPDVGMFGTQFGTAPPGSLSGGFPVGQAPSEAIFGGNPFGDVTDMTGTTNTDINVAVDNALGGMMDVTDIGNSGPVGGFDVSVDSPYGGNAGDMGMAGALGGPPGGFEGGGFGGLGGGNAGDAGMAGALGGPPGGYGGEAPADAGTLGGYGSDAW